MSRELVRVIEGTTTLLVPEAMTAKGPAKRSAIFYNPAMEFNRDISVLVSSALHKKKSLDGLAGTGIRGVRLANEAGGELLINDKNPLAYEVIKTNIRLNALDNADARCSDLNALLSTGRFDYIDIDPYGAPVAFIDGAMRALRDRGVLGITATDTAVLCGVYPKTCLRRYGAWPLKTKYAHEIGLRILIAHCIREGLRYDLAVRPLLAHSTDHYFRVYLGVERGARRANECLGEFGFIHHDYRSGARWVSRKPAEDDKSDNAHGIAGPLWLGKLFDKGFIAGLKPGKNYGTLPQIRKMLVLWREEADGPVLYYETGELARLARVSAPPLSAVIGTLRDNGHEASRTHFSPSSIKTDASVDALKRIFEACSRVRRGV